jgi:hypothetical protein
MFCLFFNNYDTIAAQRRPLCIDMPHSIGKRHRTAAIGAVGETYGMSHFMHRLFDGPHQDKGAIRRQTIKLLMQACKRNHCRRATQLRLTQHEAQHRNK